VDDGRDFNFITQPWLPVIRASGRSARVRPDDLTDLIHEDPIVDLDFPRPDFRCATLEFLIGLLTVACPPRNDWDARWKAPPSRTELEAAFAPFKSVFTFDGDDVRAYQDQEDFATEPTTIEAILIEAPGAATVKKNAALLVKPGRIEVLSRSAAAIALLTLQTMAPAGGAGHRTSLRGGGPLTTLVLPMTPPHALASAVGERARRRRVIDAGRTSSHLSLARAHAIICCRWSNNDAGGC
jgi:CRISPR system Cascade subunit CasA